MLTQKTFLEAVMLAEEGDEHAMNALVAHDLEQRKRIERLAKALKELTCHSCGTQLTVTRELSSYAFNRYGHDAKLYNGIHDLETKLGASPDTQTQEQADGR